MNTNTNTNTSTTEVEAPSQIVCSHCGCSIDCCAFCDETGCAVAICYGCMIVEVGQTAAQPHDHGG
jgi:hypothetical protein